MGKITEAEFGAFVAPYEGQFQTIEEEIYSQSDARQEILITNVVNAALEVLKSQGIFTGETVIDYAKNLFNKYYDPTGSINFERSQNNNWELVSDYTNELIEIGIIRFEDTDMFRDRIRKLQHQFITERSAVKKTGEKDILEFLIDLQKEGFLIGSHDMEIYNVFHDEERAYKRYYRNEIEKHILEIENFRNQYCLEAAMQSDDLSHLHEQLDAPLTREMILEINQTFHSLYSDPLEPNPDHSQTLRTYLTSLPYSANLLDYGQNILLRRHDPSLIDIDDYIRDFRQYNDWVFDTPPKRPDILRNIPEPFANHGGIKKNPRPQPEMLTTFNELFGEHIHIQDPGRKNLERLRDKFSRVGTFIDICRCRVTCETPELASAFTDQLATVTEIYDEPPVIYPSGAYNHTTNAVTGSETVMRFPCEIQISDPDLATANEFSHPIYETIRKFYSRTKGFRKLGDDAPSAIEDLKQEYNRYITMVFYPEYQNIRNILNLLPEDQQFKLREINSEQLEDQQSLKQCVTNLQRLHQAIHVHYMSEQNAEWLRHFIEMTENMVEKQKTKPDLHDIDRFPEAFLEHMKERLQQKTAHLASSHDKAKSGRKLY